MTAVLILAVGVGLGLGILSVVAWALLKHPHLPLSERIGLGLLGAGVVWGGLNRFVGRPVDLGDVIFLAGVVLVLWRYLGVNPKVQGVK